MSRLQDIRNTMATHAANVQKPVAVIDLTQDSPVPAPRAPQRAADAAPVAVAKDIDASGSPALPQGQSWQQCLWDCLHSGAPPSSFTCSFRLAPNIPPPLVAVEGVGQLVLPLSPEQAATLRGVAEQAPYGKGMATVVDTDVRSALQVDASKVAIDASWEAMLGIALPAMAQALGLKGPAASSIRAELYKLLLYERGGHFAAHRDTEKAPRMFATLVVQLPCIGGHEGGRLVVRHGGREVAVDTAQAAANTVQCTAFFADCEHQLLPVTAGRRLVLAYNLCWTGQGSAPHAPDRLKSAALAAAVRAWERELAGGGSQERLVLPLEHHYTDANLSFANLKGGDRRLAHVAATCPLLDCHLALLTRTVSGGTDSPVYEKYHKRRRYWDDDEDEDEEDYGDGGDGTHTMAEVYDDVTRTVWRALDGSQIAYQGLCPDTEYFHPEGDELFGDEPDDEEYEDYTGNAGPTLEQIYHKAVLVLWPRTRSLALARATGVEAVLSLLAVRLLGCTTGSTDDVSTARQQAQEALAAAIGLFEQPPQRGYCGGSNSRTPAGSALAYALQLLLAMQAAGLPNAEQMAVRLLAAPCWVQGMAQGSKPAAAALGKLAAACMSEALNEGMMQLVQRWAAAGSQLQACAALVAALARAPQLQHRVALAAADGLLGAGDVVFAAQPPESVLAMSDLLLVSPDLAASHYIPFVEACMRRKDSQALLLQQLLKSAALKAQPEMWEQVALAAADALLGPDAVVFAQQQPAQLLAMSDLLLGHPGFTASHYARFADACLRRSDCQQLLQQLLKSANVVAATALPVVQQLVAARLKYLEGQAAPTFSWRMPQASLPNYPQVETFLRGPEKAATFHIFNNVQHARNWGSKYFHGYGSNNTYSARADAGGRGSSAYCQVVKTEDWHNRQVQHHKELLAELQAVRAMFVQAVQVHSGAPVDI